MLLSDHSIRECVENETIVVDPMPEEEQYQPASLDVRLDDTVYNPVTDNYSDLTNRPLVLQPGKPLLCSTEEHIELPNDVAAQLAGRSSVARQGVIVHKTAGWIDPGFKGKITLEMYNFGDEPWSVYPGERIAQLVFMQLDYPSEGYDGQYQDQVGPTQ